MMPIGQFGGGGCHLDAGGAASWHGDAQWELGGRQWGWQGGAGVAWNVGAGVYLVVTIFVYCWTMHWGGDECNRDGGGREGWAFWGLYFQMVTMRTTVFVTKSKILCLKPPPVSAPLDWPFDQQVMLCNLSFTELSRTIVNVLGCCSNTGNIALCGYPHN